jgi:hypothetical protein
MQTPLPLAPDALSATALQLEVDRVDRWFIYHRLQELMIPSWSLADGSLWVEANHAATAALIWLVVQQCLQPRSTLVDWLERCWQAD